MNLKDKNKKDFLDDLILLAQQYGYKMEEVLDILCAKQKTELELFLDVAEEKYKNGVMFVDVHQKDTRISSGNVELLYDRIWCWDNESNMCLVYRPEEKQWAEIINDIN